MKIVVIGTGYVGLVTGVCFAEMGNKVVCVDVNQRKIEMLNQGMVPIYEPTLEKIMKDNVEAGRLRFEGSYECLKEKTDLCFIAVGTPMSETGEANLQYVEEAAKMIGKMLEEPAVIVNKSTVPVNTGAKVEMLINGCLRERGKDFTIDVASNPEFLREGSAVTDCLHPDRIVAGVEKEELKPIFRELYRNFMEDDRNLIFMDRKSAEMTKYAANCMLATKISFINQIANLCEFTGADINLVKKGIGTDSRIGSHFINPGCGYGGSCFPKDIQALIALGENLGCNVDMLQEVRNTNERQKHLLAQKALRRFDGNLEGKTFGIWGLAFKPNTDDMRDASAIVVVNDLLKHGARVKVYDPKAMNEAQNFYFKGLEDITYCEDKMDVIEEIDALFILTEWKQFLQPDFDEMKAKMNQPVIFDGRNIYNRNRLKKSGFEYYEIGVKIDE
ncbi:MAG: UDP-glucose/GDP-mannose dehydrogenase family protein [Schaedlerella sp.]|nr:UDP-glucose/GDP-mannose dehydrogenase family protein [Schaedlerella sp.]